jgi:hypothetical protein
MHIAPTGFPGHLSGYRLFWFKAPWSSRSVGDELNLAPRRRQSDPDQFPDDVVDRVEPREPVLGDDAVRRTIGLFELCVGLGMPCDLFAQRRNPLAGNAAEPKKRPE